MFFYLQGFYVISQHNKSPGIFVYCDFKRDHRQLDLWIAKDSLGEFWLKVHRYIGARIAQV